MRLSLRRQRPAVDQDRPAGDRASVGKVRPPDARTAAALAEVDEDTAGSTTSGFQVHLANFTGPFDLLLQLLSKQKLEITELSLSKVTDEFIAYLRAMGDQWSLDEASEFLVVAATLLDLKAAKLLPQGEVEDEEDLALLEARDLLFARLLQYRAFKEAAAMLAELDARFSRGYPRAVKLEPRFAEALPEFVLGIGPDRLAQMAIRALAPRILPSVPIDHIHMVRVSVREHAQILLYRLRAERSATFRALVADCETILEIVARFLAVLELYREGLIAFEQATPLGELTLTWIGDEAAQIEMIFDEYEETAGDEPGSAPPAGAASADVVSADVASADIVSGVEPAATGPGANEERRR